jgi:hypothetical protein
VFLTLSKMVAPPGFEPRSPRHFIIEIISMVPKPEMLDHYTTGLYFVS